MYDIETLKEMEKILKKRLHDVAAEIQRDLTTVQEAIHVAEKMNRQGLTVTPTIEKSVNDITQDMELVEVVKIIMAEKPEIWWQAVDIAARLEELGYEKYGGNLAPNISNTLRPYSKPTDKRLAFFEVNQKGKWPTYRLVK